ncbi:hypothetical protein T440DRAFT_514731 [Plenodomus tracheiphilus IPT5]|uniref:SAP domain-containing protein n=1 Tax=Plenodomus tracheiphilus IPT5 TaxID=1408161 RepID=A0A6A7BHE7_9PLEO|nr:hypothetical protein T440DRAFT_514731 [Plenodomus tracheiphilus IPT5]
MQPQPRGPEEITWMDPEPPMQQDDTIDAAAEDVEPKDTGKCKQNESENEEESLSLREEIQKQVEGKTMFELRGELKRRKLGCRGNTEDLVGRLVEWVVEERLR